MTNGEKLKAMFQSMIVGFITESQIGIYFVKNQNSASVFSLDWWNAEYKEPTTECEQSINKSAMMQEIYMEGVNMGGEYQGCWVRFKEIEKIVDKYVR